MKPIYLNDPETDLIVQALKLYIQLAETYNATGEEELFQKTVIQTAKRIEGQLTELLIESSYYSTEDKP